MAQLLESRPGVPDVHRVDHVEAADVGLEVVGDLRGHAERLERLRGPVHHRCRAALGVDVVAVREQDPLRLGHAAAG
jgi:hypothetical protein